MGEAAGVASAVKAGDKTGPNLNGSSSIFALRDGHSLEFDDIRLATKSKHPEKNPPKQILKGVTSQFPAKTLTAIMGPSGEFSLMI